jgi:glycyl-tRNA synthetase beta chain
VVTRPNLALLQASITAQKEKVRQGILSFVRERLVVMLRDQGFSANEVDAVLAVGPLVVADVPERLAAVRSFSALPESSALAAANKRVGNILKKAETSVVPIVDEALLKEHAEVALYGTLCKVSPVAEAAFERREYTASLRALAVLRAPVDAFFESVMVNAEDPALRANRLGLLAQLHTAMNRVADLSKLAA